MEEHNNISQELLETIERFITRSMDKEEYILFEKRMEADPVLRQQVNDLRIILSGLETSILKEKMNAFHKEISSENSKEKKVRPTIKKIKKSKYPVFAIAAVCVALFGTFYFMSLDSTSEKLFSKYFIADPGLPTTMSSNSNFDFYDAMVNYKREEYTIAIAKWEKLSEEKIDNDTLNYYLGVSYLAHGDSEKALNYLETLGAYPESMFAEDAIYYRALALIRLGETAKASKLLQAYPTVKNDQLLFDLNKNK
ncbi:tetratricopeptide repeat protein [Ulvibacter sp. MAR_2010_11]|uniref:tetratricopeptide repeat protein n=1 Tax=Ulvibacter sp. MAR_2010_11 TaxID=1250229 RepID=UPI000CC04542|nr:tetratricopeptide repeat protein [Ulvibacter sp. MAR_2010_11]PKA82558.1 tetratricopeptide repeat protein [Ulvibacter sp. MAR_2010_11]